MPERQKAGVAFSFGAFISAQQLKGWGATGVKAELEPSLWVTSMRCCISVVKARNWPDCIAAQDLGTMATMMLLVEMGHPTTSRRREKT